MLIKGSKLLIIAFFFLIANTAFAINDFTIDLDSIPQKCEGDGSVIIKIGNTEPTATFEFLTYRLNNNGIYAFSGFSDDSVAIGTTLTDTLSGLSSGSYRIIAYQWTLDGDHNCDTAYTQVLDSSIILSIRSYASDEAYDCNYNAIGARVYDGIGPFVYELVDASNDATIMTITSSNKEELFSSASGIADGTYYVKITDGCGNSETTSDLTHVNAVSPPSYSIACQFDYYDLVDCDSIQLRPDLGSGYTKTPTVYPIVVTVEVTCNSTTTTQIYYYDDYVGNGYGSYDRDMLMVSDLGDSHSVTISLIDACGTTATSSFTVTPSFSFSLGTSNSTCGGRFLRLFNDKYLGTPFTVEFVQAPTSFISNLNNYNSDWTNGNSSLIYPTSTLALPVFGSDTNPVPEGLYEIKVTNCDGSTYTRSITVNDDYDKTINSTQTDDCAIGYGKIQVYYSEANIDVEKVYINSAPSAFTTMYSVGSYPFDASGIWPITTAGRQYLDSLPSGSYEIYTTDKCTGDQSDNTVTVTVIAGDTSSYSSSLSQTCDGIAVTAAITTTLSWPFLELQKYFVEDDEWKNPTGSGSSSIDICGDGHVTFTSKTISGTENISTDSPEGMYRIFMSSRGSECFIIDTLYLTDTYSIELNDYYVSQCSNSEINIMIDASGNEPLNYEITAIDGVPASIDNGTSPVFTGLSPGTEYTVTVTNACNDAKSFTCSTSFLRSPVIKPSSLCVGSVGQLYIKGLSFMNIEWYSGTVAPANYISTGNSIEFNTFVLGDAGTYCAVLSYVPNTNDCMDDTLYFTIDPSHITNAGIGRDTLISKNTAATFSLFDLLSGTYDEYGTWSEISTDGMINGEYLYAASLPVGSYEFMYAVEDGYCSDNDTTYVTVHIVNELIHAETDSLEVCPETNYTNIGNVMDNDTTLLGVAVTPSYFMVTDLSGGSEVIILPNGNIRVTASTQSGKTYIVKYRVEDISQSLNYDIDSVVVQTYSTLSAGEDSTLFVAPNSGSITMFDKLGGLPDVGGVWWNEDYSATPTAIFDIPGSNDVYVFHYVVNNSTCGNDTATLTINVTYAPGGVADNLKLWMRADQGTNQWVTNDYWFDFFNGDTCMAMNNVTLNSIIDLHNFNPGVSFDGTDDYIDVYDGFSDFINGLASFVVANPDNKTNVADFYLLDETSPPNSLISLGQNATNVVGYESGSGVSYSGAIAELTDQLYGFNIEGGTALSIAACFLNVNGFYGTTGSVNVPANVTRTLNTIGSTSYAGDILEVVIYNRNLSAIDRRRVDSYLAIKYGLTLSADNDGSGASNLLDGSTTIYEGDYLVSDTTIIWDATKFISYNNAIFGIGTDSVSLLVQKISQSVEDNTLIIANNQEFTLSNFDVSRTALADTTFIVIGNNGAGVLFTKSFYGKSNKVMTRLWAADVTGEPDSVFVAVPNTFDFPHGIPVVIISVDDENIESTDDVIELSDDGIYYWAKIPIKDLTNNADFYFTFGSLDNIEYMRHGKHFKDGKEQKMTF